MSLTRIIALLLIASIAIKIANADGSSGGGGGGGGGGDGSSGGGGGGGGSETDVEHQSRTVQINVQSNQIQIESVSSASGGLSNKFEANLDVNDPRLEVRMDMYTQASDSSSSFDFRLKLDKVAEYVENGAAGSGYDPSTDTTGKVWTFSQNSFTFSSLADSTVGNVTLKNFQGVSGDGVFTIIGHISGGLFTAGAAGTITPISFKFDLVIDGSKFGYTLNNSRLALVASVQSESSQSTRLLDDAGTDVTSTGGSRAKTVLLGAAASPIGFFTWTNTVTINGGSSTANIIASPLTVDSSDHEGDNEGQTSRMATFAFDYIQPSKIEWDPVVGAGAGSLVSSSASVRPLALLTALVAALSFVFSR